MLGGVTRLLGAVSLTFGPALLGNDSLMVGGELFEFGATFGGIELVGRERVRAAGAEEVLESIDKRVALVGEGGQRAFGRSG